MNIKEIIKKEKDISYQVLGSEDDPEIMYIPGKNGILISAPHGAVHYRNHKSKEEDEYTAGIAQWLAEKTSSHVIYLRRRVMYDPNHDLSCPYKEKLAYIVRENQILFVLDIHGASSKRDFGIALGTMNGSSCPESLKELIINSLAKSDFSEKGSGLDGLDIDQTFSAAGSKQRMTITKFSHREMGISAVQLELNAKLRIPERRSDATLKEPFSGDPGRIANTLITLKKVVHAIEGFYHD